MGYLAAAVLSAIVVGVPGTSSEPAEALVRLIEARHRRAEDLTARFTQTYRSGMLGRQLTESGTVSIKRPGRMRWDYERPEKKLFVCDGEKYYFYIPQDRQVIVRDQAEDRRAPALLLAGEGRILEQFEAVLERTGPGRERLRLTPREPDPDVRQVFVEADPSGRITVIEVLDAQGNRSRFGFESYRENLSLKDELFRFEIPPGVEVVSG